VRDSMFQKRKAADALASATSADLGQQSAKRVGRFVNCTFRFHDKTQFILVRRATMTKRRMNARPAGIGKHVCYISYATQYISW